MKPFKRLAARGVVACLLVLAACASAPEPFTYTPDNELKPGPGLFTGEDGVYTIYGTPPATPAEGEDNGEDAGVSSPSAAGAD